MVRLLGTGREGYRTNRPPSSCATLVAWPRNHGLLTPPVPIYIRPRSSVSHRCSLLPPLRPGSRTPRYQPVVYPSYSALSLLACPTINTIHTVLSLLWEHCSTLDAHLRTNDESTNHRREQSFAPISDRVEYGFRSTN